jgi:L-threonylcarbamoyladenylate synthase
MAPQNTVRLADSARGISAAAGLLRAGELVAFPTETVYGLGADARQDRAVAAIFAAKGRPAFNPLIVHVADLAAAETLADFPAAARALARTFWPGPLTLVLPRRPEAGLSDLVAAGLPTVALRAPSHPLARRLLAALAGPVAAPSANPSGRVSATTAGHVLDGLGGRIAAVLDGGACPVGIESTIIGFEDGAPVLLRPGGLGVEAIEAALGRPLAARAASGVSAPGQLASHYAPDTPLRLDAARPEPGEVWLGFGAPDAAVDAAGCPGLNLSPAGDLAEAAANLFAHLRTIDALARAAGAARIAVAPVPRDGLGLAINDRLARAAAPRG